MEENTPQPKLTKNEVLDIFAQKGFDPEYADFYWSQYSEFYDSTAQDVPDDDRLSDDALSAADDGLSWYALYKEIGHPESWCIKACDFGINECGKVDSLEDIADCLIGIYSDQYEVDKEIAAEELRRHCNFIAAKFGKSELYMRFFYEWYEGGDGGSRYLKTYDELEQSYLNAISEGKDDSFAHFFATKSLVLGVGAWRLAEAKEQLEQEGRDNEYISSYLWKYEKEIVEHGDPGPADHPEWWEEKVVAYMKGWEYAHTHGLDEAKFAELHEPIYLNMHHSYERIPDFEDNAIEEALRQYAKK